MKTKLQLFFGCLLFVVSACGQGTLIVSPVPVTNGITGTLADSSIVAALYYGASGATEENLVALLPASPLVGGFARFDSQTPVIPLPPVTSLLLQVRAWSAGYPTYETAAGSGLASVLAGQSVPLAATLGGSPLPPPTPNPLSFPGFTVLPVPEPTSIALGFVGAVLAGWWRARQLR